MSKALYSILSIFKKLAPLKSAEPLLHKKAVLILYYRNPHFRAESALFKVKATINMLTA
jgi:hypothetical protein